MLRRSILRFAPVVFFAAPGWAQEDVVTVASPNGRIVFRLFDGPPPTVDTQLPHLAYQVDYDGRRLIVEPLDPGAEVARLARRHPHRRTPPTR